MLLGHRGTAPGQDFIGIKRLPKQFPAPGGIPSHASPECHGSILEGGELGYSLNPAFEAAFIIRIILLPA